MTEIMVSARESEKGNRIGGKPRLERPAYVANYIKPRNTEIKHINNAWYLYECTSHYDPNIKRSRKKSGLCLGKITEKGLISAQRRIVNPSELIVNDTVDIGNLIFYWDKTKLIRERLKVYFPEIWKEIYIISIIRATKDCRFRRIQVNYENSILSYIYKNILFNSKNISLLLDYLGKRRENISSYMKESMDSLCNFILFDGHRIITSSKKLEFAERGYDSRKRNMPQINVIYAFTINGDIGMPAYYKQYLGSTVDVYAFSDILNELNIRDKDYTIIGDKGFSSYENFDLIDDLNLKYIVPLKRDNIFIQNKIPKSPLEYTKIFTYHKRAIHSKIIKSESIDNTKFKIHLFYDPELYSDEIYCAVKKAEEKNEKNKKKKIKEEKRRKKKAEKLADEQYNDLQEQNIDDIYSNKEAIGTITIRTNRLDLSSDTIYKLYKRRQEIEQFFKTYGDTINFESSYMRNRTHQEAWLFLNHISSSIIMPSINELLHTDDKKSISLQDLHKTLDKITASLVGEKWHMPKIKKSVQKLLRDLDLEISVEKLEAILAECPAHEQPLPTSPSLDEASIP